MFSIKIIMCHIKSIGTYFALHLRKISHEKFHCNAIGKKTCPLFSYRNDLYMDSINVKPYSNI